VAKKNKSTKLTVRLPNQIVEKINYLLSRFKSTEWSGPAWYTLKAKAGNGFPTEVELSYFKPIDLGGTASTELDGEALGEILPEIYKTLPKLKKSYLGLIHSHHNMGAFFSGTDKSTALEQAPGDGLFFSTVVAHEKKKFCCGVSYRDQFGLPNFIEGKVKHGYRAKVNDAWKKEADTIEEDARTVPTVVGWQSNQHQLNLANGWGMNRGVLQPQKKKKTLVSKVIHL